MYLIEKKVIYHTSLTLDKKNQSPQYRKKPEKIKVPSTGKNMKKIKVPSAGKSMKKSKSQVQGKVKLLA